ncbi:hypothetical protein Agub_g11970, partial [Astrephomene gubernaculifera]
SVQFLAARAAASHSKESSMTTATADDAIAGLEPAPLWRFFKDLTQIPRPSKHEERVLQYLKEFAASRQLAWQQDAVGNLVIRRPGSGGGQGAPPVVIQGHIDMVCEKAPAVPHDFLRDPLTLVRRGDWLSAQGTTLGADNGIGVAAALALLDCPPSAKLPPLECLFTIDEETGLTGAFEISPDLLTGRTMLNLDTEDWGEVFIGCAGGGDMRLVLQVALQRRPEQPAMRPFKLQLGGLLGGHSGLNIGEGRGNAVQLLGRALEALGRAAAGDGTAATAGAVAAAAGGVGDAGWRLVAAGGGDKRNAIARDAWAVVLVAEERVAAVTAAVQSLLEELRTEYGTLEKDLTLTLTPYDTNYDDNGEQQQQQRVNLAEVVAPADVARLLALLRGLPHGPLKYSHAVPGLVETSNNVASLQEQQPATPAEATAAEAANGTAGVRRYAIVTSTRSSLSAALEATRDVIQGLAGLAGCVELERGRAYPGWQPNLDSGVLQVTLDAYREVLGEGRGAKVGAIHAGLECGILGQRFPGMDMVSFGPTIKGAHSPEERVQLSTVRPFWELTLRILERLADVRQ